MECIVSRRKMLPATEEELRDALWFVLWVRKQWPYKEVVVGDCLYFYEWPTQAIVWRSKIVDVDRFVYDSKAMMIERLRARFGDFDTTQPYIEQAEPPGYCLAWKVAPLERVNYPKPIGFSMRQLGWQKVDDEIADQWQLPSIAHDITILDEIVTAGPLSSRLRQLNEAMADIVPERVRSIVAVTLRRDTAMVKSLKELVGFRCQFPGCGATIRKRDGSNYIEVAHIQPVKHGGQSTLGNLLVLCPNHHKEFDFGELHIDEQTVELLRGRINGKEFSIQLATVAPNP